MINRLAHGFLTTVFPPVCAACSKVGREPFCRICAESLEVAPPLSLSETDEAHALWTYGGPVALAIQNLKYEGHPELGRPLGRAMRQILPRYKRTDLLAVPVPLSKKRLRKRGFNQTRELLRGLGLPLAARALIRTDSPKEQVGLNKAERLKNLRSAFQPGPDTVRNRHVLLVDDVLTTGATAEAAIASLHKAKAASVRLLVLARTL